MLAKALSERLINRAGLWLALFVSSVVPAGLADAQSVNERPYVKIEKIFGDTVDFDQKLLEVEGVSLDTALPGDMLCLIAAVRLKPDAAPKPPRRDMARPWLLQFGGVWKPTPLPSDGPKGRDLLQVCGAYLQTEGLDEAILTALEQPGSFFAADLTGTVLPLYAPEWRLAVSIRYVRRNPDR